MSYLVVVAACFDTPFWAHSWAHRLVFSRRISENGAKTMQGDGFLDRTGHRMWAPDNWARVKEVFAGARPLPADRRAAYLAEACDGNEVLRQEVECLLSSDERAKSFLEAPAVVRGGDTR